MRRRVCPTIPFPYFPTCLSVFVSNFHFFFDFCVYFALLSLAQIIQERSVYIKEYRALSTTLIEFYKF